MGFTASNHKISDENVVSEKGITIHISFNPMVEDLLPKLKRILEDFIGSNSKTHEPDEILTPDDLASIWKVPKSKIYALTMQTDPGSIPRFKIGRHLRFRRSEIDKWAAKQDIK